MTVIDTSVWIGTLLTGDAHFAESSAWFATQVAENQGFHIPMLIIPELAGVLAQNGVSGPDIAEAAREIIEARTVHLHELALQSTLLATRIAASTGMKGADAVFVALAANLGFPLVSWDKQQRERGAMFCRTMTPVEAMEMAE